MVRAPLTVSASLECLIAGVASALCRESGLDAPLWAGVVVVPCASR